AVTEEPARIEIEPFERAFNHAFGSQHLCLPDCRGRLDIDDDRVLDVDQVVRRVGEEGLATVRPCPARRWIGGRHELRRDFGRCSESGIVEDSTRYSSIARPAASGGSPLSPSIPLCRLASALIRLASTANPSPPTSRSSMQRRKTLSNTRRKRSLCLKRPCL